MHSIDIKQNFIPQPIYPHGIDTDYTLFQVKNTTESTLSQDNQAWSEIIHIRAYENPYLNEDPWPENGFATLDGELLYYGSTEKDYTTGKVIVLKDCIRNLNTSKTTKKIISGFTDERVASGFTSVSGAGVTEDAIIGIQTVGSGKPTHYNLAGTPIKGFVVAEHHNQLVKAIVNVENFIGIDFDENQKTLDWKIRNLFNTTPIFDDYGCPDVNFTVTTLKKDQNSGTLISFNLSITGDYKTFRIDFGDGTSTTNTLSGTHLYPVSVVIDPVVNVESNSCNIVQTPINRDNPTEPTIPVAPEPILIQIPECPAIPPININIPSLPQTIINLPPIVFPIFDIGLPNINIPSIITIDPPIPSLINFGPIGAIPSLIEFGPISIPSVIIVTPTIPSIIKIDTNIPNIPSIIKIDGSLPSIIKVDGSIPSIIKIGGIIPSIIKISPMPPIPPISFIVPKIISKITIESNFPSSIKIVVPSNLCISICNFKFPCVSFCDVPKFTPISFGKIPSFTCISFCNVPSFANINFEKPPSITVYWTPPVISIQSPYITPISFVEPPLFKPISFSNAPSIPGISIIMPESFPCISICDKLPTISFSVPPSLIVSFGVLPKFDKIKFENPPLISFGNVPKIEFGNAPSLECIQFCEPPSFQKIGFDKPPVFEEIVFGDAPSLIIRFDTPPTIGIDYGRPPNISVDWGTPPIVSCMVRVVCPAEAVAAALNSGKTNVSQNDNGKGYYDEVGMKVGYDFVGIPEEIKLIVPEINDITVLHDIPEFISLILPEMKNIKVEFNEPIPSEIKLNHDIPEKINIDAASIPEFIKIDSSELPSVIKLQSEIEIPKNIKIEFDSFPSSISVTGIPDHIELVGVIPSEIKLTMPEKPEIEMVYKGSPIEVKVELDYKKLFGDKHDEDLPCFAIIPCPPRK